MMARVVIRKPEIPCFVLNSQVRVADWEQVCGTHQGQRQMSKPRSKAGHRTVLTNRVINAFYPCNADAIHTGQSGLARLRLLLTQHCLACAVARILQHSGYHRSGHSEGEVVNLKTAVPSAFAGRALGKTVSCSFSRHRLHARHQS